MNKENSPFYIPEAEELLKKLKEQPTEQDRLAALENAFAEFVISLTGGDM